ncbi:MAG: ATP-dependent DNA helicase RecG [Clostridiales bacterium]|nr:ATP-dependent DNA helicase RecG [Clostridiales bacterium]
MDETALTSIKGIGPSKAAKLAKLGLISLSDMLSYAPVGYIDLSNVREISSLADGETAVISVALDRDPVTVRLRGGIGMVSLYCSDATEKIRISYFNQTYRAKQFTKGYSFMFYGKINRSRGASMTNPMCIKEGEGIIPVYKTVAGVSQTNLRDIAKKALECLGSQMQETLPDSVRTRYTLCTREYATRNIHFPISGEALMRAKMRFEFERFVTYFYMVKRYRKEREQQKGVNLNATTILEDYEGCLSFDLTDAQKRVINEIARDISGDRPMGRLVQGDVGSGKTAVAMFLIYAAVNAGRQAVFMAPTEILAEQHYNNLKTIFGDKACLLRGGMSVAEKRASLENIRTGKCLAIAGTHALLSQDVEFFDLAAVITDEQHRFGVSQRAALEGKGFVPHTLIMSATPIPRTLALIMYGDLEVSVIDELPPGRKPIKTFLVRPNKRDDMYRFIENLAKDGKQTYIVCPAVEQNDEITDMRSAEEVYDELKPALCVPVGILHGKQKAQVKAQTIERFREREIMVLVSTTVIEVGIDIRNATVMVVENAERFGLSQLHQLRGRVGRGSEESYCFLMYEKMSDTATERLKTLASTCDGFEIAKKDLELRGPGDFWGTRQHGEADFSWFSELCDVKLVKQASECVELILSDDELYDDMRELLDSAVSSYYMGKDRITLN